jgi:UPF0271 protein
MPLVTSANVCCGLHAGGPSDIRDAIRLAVLHHVVIGAHPGFDDREHFGRREVADPPAALAAVLAYQIGALTAVARLAGVPLKYLKPHGALYNQACRDDRFARPVAAAALLNGLPVVGLPGSVLAEVCRELNVAFVAEGFADRRYRADGSLVPRSEPDAMIHEPAEALNQIERLRERGVRTVCVHGDTPGAVAFTHAVRDGLLTRGYNLKAFG